MLIELRYVVAVAGLWALGNGILHDVFVLAQRKPYDRDLIRLLIDGHVLIFSGILYLCCYEGIRSHNPLAYFIAAVVACFLIGYCALIYKILPSFVTIIINLITLGAVATGYLSLS